MATSIFRAHYRRVPSRAASTDPASRRLLAVAWAAVAAAVALLLWRFPALPDLVPAYRTPSGALLVPKSVPMVLRLPLIGVASLLVVDTLLRITPPGGWRALWRAAAAAVAVKTFAEAGEFALLGTAEEGLRVASLWAAVLAVVAFLGVATGLWLRGQLTTDRAAPMGWRDLPGRARLVLVGAGCSWAVLASAPAWMG